MSRSVTRDPAAYLARYLLPREAIVAIVRRHPATLLPAIAEAFGVLAVGLPLTLGLDLSQSAKFFIIALISLEMVGLFYRVADWLVRYLIITSERAIAVSGIFSLRVATTPLDEMRDIVLHRRLGDRLIGSGAISSESNQKTFLHLPYPEQMYLLIASRIFKAGAEDEDEPDDEITREGREFDRGAGWEVNLAALFSEERDRKDKEISTGRQVSHGRDEDTAGDVGTGSQGDGEAT